MDNTNKERIQLGKYIFMDCVNKRHNYFDDIFYIKNKTCEERLRMFLIDNKEAELHTKYIYTDNYNKFNKKKIINYDLETYKKTELIEDFNTIINLSK